MRTALSGHVLALGVKSCVTLLTCPLDPDEHIRSRKALKSIDWCLGQHLREGRVHGAQPVIIKMRLLKGGMATRRVEVMPIKA